MSTLSAPDAAAAAAATASDSHKKKKKKGAATGEGSKKSGTETTPVVNTMSASMSSHARAAVDQVKGSISTILSGAKRKTSSGSMHGAKSTSKKNSKTRTSQLKLTAARPKRAATTHVSQLPKITEEDPSAVAELVTARPKRKVNFSAKSAAAGTGKKLGSAVGKKGKKSEKTHEKSAQKHKLKSDSEKATKKKKDGTKKKRKSPPAIISEIPTNESLPTDQVVKQLAANMEATITKTRATVGNVITLTAMGSAEVKDTVKKARSVGGASTSASCVAAAAGTTIGASAVSDPARSSAKRFSVKPRVIQSSVHSPPIRRFSPIVTKSEQYNCTPTPNIYIAGAVKPSTSHSSTAIHIQVNDLTTSPPRTAAIMKLADKDPVAPLREPLGGGAAGGAGGSSNSSLARKRKINEENSAKTNSEAAAAGGPSTSTQPAEEDKDKEEDKDAKKKKNRCAECRKKVGLTGFQCRCGGLYCAVHRYSDKHDCTFNYREHGAQEIRRNNPVVVGEKIQKI